MNGYHRNAERVSSGISKYNSSKYDPSYAAAWMVPDEVAQIFDDETDYGVILLAKVFRVIKHKNHV